MITLRGPVDRCPAPHGGPRVANAILVVGCTIGGLAIVVGFVQTLFGMPYGGLRNMVNGAVVVVCKFVGWAFLSPTPAVVVSLVVPGEGGA